MVGEGGPLMVEWERDGGLLGIELWECDDGVLGTESECLTFLIICSLRSANSFLNASIAALQ